MQQARSQTCDMWVHRAALQVSLRLDKKQNKTKNKHVFK